MSMEKPKTLDVYTPKDNLKPLGIIHFIHGMAEHKNRYKETIDFFVENGYVCAISDLRGHGDNIKTENDLGYFGENGDEGFVEDIHKITLYLKEQFPDLIYYMLGHSMGSLIARAYLKKYDEHLDGLILSGSPSDAFGRSLGSMLIKNQKNKFGEYHRSDQINNLVMGKFSKPFKSDNNAFAWLSTDKNIWHDYSNDPKCGFVFTLNGFDSLMKLLDTVYTKKDWQLKNKNLPILFLSGENDPCKINDKKFLQAVNLKKKIGYKNVEYNIFSGMRHEILNETNKHLVYNKILETIKIRVPL